jgi:4'-phosphopantetheinyl transferase EntD
MTGCAEFEAQCRQALGVPVFVELGDDNAEVLTEAELAAAKAHSTRLRQEEWQRGRKMLKSVLRRAGQPTGTEAIRFPNAQVSLSHSGDLAAAVSVAKPSGLSGIGIDLQCRRPMAFGTARFFLRPEELREELSADDLLRLWTIKEAIYKADPQNSAQLLDDYRIESPKALTGQARSADRSRGVTFRYFSRELDVGYLTVAIAIEKETP